ncbi:MAG TPA: OmpA family protein [Legionellaceae bacterium]|nr:OmpA family protein [Legionellaceae bacterium]
MLKRLLSILFLSGSLLGCHSKVPTYIEDTPTLPSGVEGVSDAEIIKLYQKLQSKHVRMITMGDAYLISIPSELIFANQSPKIQWSSYDLLNDIVCYLRMYRKITVQITAYASCYKSSRRTQALTLARARAVGNYLWSQNIETRIVFTEGLGDDKPIVAITKCNDASPNSRIEIVFKQVVA